MRFLHYLKYVVWSLFFAACVVGIIAFFTIRISSPINKMYLCSANLQEIGHALEYYRDNHGHYPPAYTTDEHGRPMHSWRVLLSPYLEGGRDFYRKYRMNEPWDSPHNKKLLQTMKMPYMLRCPADSDDENCKETSYVLVVGKGTGFEGPNVSGLRNGGDDAKIFIMLVEANDSGIKWTEPRDFDITKDSCQVGSSQGLAPRSAHGFPHALFHDGHIDVLDEKMTPEAFRALVILPSEY